MILQVEHVSGPHGDIEPRAFILGERRVAVIEIIDRWLSPAYEYFRVAASDDARYILRHDTASGLWEMTLFKAPGVAP